MNIKIRRIVFFLACTGLLLAGIGVWVAYRQGELILPWYEQVPAHEFPKALPSAPESSE